MLMHAIKLIAHSTHVKGSWRYLGAKTQNWLTPKISSSSGDFKDILQAI